MKALLIALAATTALAAVAAAKEEAPAPYTVLRENVTVNLGTSINQGFGIGRDGRSVVFQEGRRWYRVQLLPPCSSNLVGEMRIGLVHRGPWFDRASQVLVGDHVCHVRKIDEIANPNPPREAAQTAPAKEAQD